MYSSQHSLADCGVLEALGWHTLNKKEIIFTYVRTALHIFITNNCTCTKQINFEVHCKTLKYWQMVSVLPFFIMFMNFYLLPLRKCQKYNLLSRMRLAKCLVVFYICRKLALSVALCSLALPAKRTE